MREHALLFTDLVGSTDLVERLGDHRAAEIWADHDSAAREILAQYHGREIDRADGFFLLFEEPVDAANFAIAYHIALEAMALSARVGLHIGLITLRQNAREHVIRGAKPMEVEGLAKPFTARVMSLAGGGQTLLSAAAQRAIRERLPPGAETRSHGYYRLKGIEEPVEIFELGLHDVSPFARPIDAEKAYQVVAVGDIWRPVRDVRHTLPAERDGFVGRTAELRAMAARRDRRARLITVLGAAGTGKTRLIVRYGWTSLGDYPGGIYFCDLSDAKSLEGFLGAVAVSLDVSLASGDPSVQLGHAIAARGRCLIVLDNFEQLLVQATPTLGRWLDRAAEAAFAVTSRERLRLPGEEILALEPLPLSRDAIELFSLRARAQDPNFSVNPTNREAVSQVVTLLDGLPLAIELAAARVRTLSPSQLVDRMTNRFRLLTGARGTGDRQRTLQAAIDWSWDLLTPWEKSALAQLSVFEGGFDLAAAEAVVDLNTWTGAPPVVDVLQALIDKSLVRTRAPIGSRVEAPDEPHFAMLISIHEYATQRLSETATLVERDAERRHGLHFSRFGTDQALGELVRHGGANRRRALADQLDNLIAACRRAVVRKDAEVAVFAFRATWEVLELRGPLTMGASIGAELSVLLEMPPPLQLDTRIAHAKALWLSGRVEEGEVLLTRALDLARELAARPKEGVVLGMFGEMHREQGRMPEARRDLEAALALNREIGNRNAEGDVLRNLGGLCSYQGQLAEARAHIDAALAIYRDVGDRCAEGTALGNLGLPCHELGRLEEARTYYEQALSIHREVGNRRNEAIVLGNLGSLHSDQGRLDEARVHFEAALAINRDLGSRRSEGIVLGNLGNIYADLGRMAEARLHYEAALTIAREVVDRRHEGFVLGGLGLVDKEQGRMGEALAHYQTALKIHREIGNRNYEGSTLGSLADLLLQNGRLGEAREALRLGEGLLREVGDRLELAKLLTIRGKAEIAFGDPERARISCEEAEQIATELFAGPTSELGHNVAALRRGL